MRRPALLAVALTLALAGAAAALALPGARPPCKTKTAKTCRTKKKPVPKPPAPPTTTTTAALPTFPAPAACRFAADGGGQQQLNEGVTDTALNPPALGTLRGIVLFLDFPDAPASESTDSIMVQTFQPAVAGYAEMSYGNFTLQVTAAPRWYRLPNASTYYGLNSSDGAGRKDEYIAAAVRAADADVDFSKYDLVYLVSAKGAVQDQATNTVRYAGHGVTSADGVEIRRAVFISQDRITRSTHGSDQVLHETGHVLGLPDLYADQNAVGGWDLMGLSATPSSTFTAWHRWKLGWFDDTNVQCVQPGETVTQTLTPLETKGGVKAIVVKLSASRFFVLEDRQKIGRDAALCDSGVIAYTVDASLPWDRQPLRIVPAHGVGASSPQCGPILDAPFDLGAGEVSSWSDPSTGVAFELLGRAGGSYTVRVTG